MPVRFLTNNLADSATLIESTQTTGFAAENVQDKRLTKRWRTSSESAFTIHDNCETADWTQALAGLNEVVDGVNFIEGAGSLKLGKDGTNTVARYTKTFSAINLTSKRLRLAVFVIDSTALNKLDVTLPVRIYARSSASDFFIIPAVTRAALTAGAWVLIGADSDVSTWSRIGTPDITAITSIRIEVKTTNAGDLLTSGDVGIDNLNSGIFDESIEFDFTTAQAVTAAVIDGHDFDGTETDIILDSSTDAITWTNRATFTFASGEAMAVFIDSVSARYWRIKFSKSLITETKEIGRVFIGTYTQPARGIQLGWRRTLSDSSQTKRAFSGTQFADIRPKWWEWDFKIKCEATGTFDTLRTALSTLGIGTSLWIAIDPVNNPNGPFTLYGRFSKPWSESEPINDVFDVSFKFAEDL